MILGADDGQLADRVVAGRYRLERLLGRGGMGVVWRAIDMLIERTVAIKELRAPAGATQSEQSSFVERALREARHAGRLNHPNVVAVYDALPPTGDDGAVYIVMEYVQAPSLADILDRKGPLPGPLAAAVGLGILDALDAAHALGIVHRDVKPANVLVGEPDRVKLTDFGIALAAADTRMTRSGVIGTQAYLAAECFDTGQAGPAADLWALGATLYHAVSGRAPFDRDTTTATLRAILFEDPPTPHCEPRLAEAITGLLIRPVEQRLASPATRQLLQPVAVQPATGAGPAAAITDPARTPWEAHSTTLHRQPSDLAPPQPAFLPAPSAPTAPAFPGPAAPPSGYPTGGYGPPPQLPPPAGPPPGPSWNGAPPRSSRTPWVIAGAVVAVAAVALILVLALSGGGGKHDASNPSGPNTDPGQSEISGLPREGTKERAALDATGRLITAMKSDDYSGALDLTTGGSHEAILNAQANSAPLKGSKGTELVDFKPKTVVLASSQDIVQATVTMSLIRADGSTTDGQFLMELSDGSWKASSAPFYFS